MKITLVQDSLSPDLRKILGNLPQARQNVLRRVGERFAEQAKENIGDSGTDRPKVWEALRNKRYAKKVNRSHATLKGKKAVLRDSIQADAPTNSSITVGSNVEYSAVHQFGGGKNIPSRPYFPVTENGELTPQSEAELTAIVEQELSKFL